MIGLELIPDAAGVPSDPKPFLSLLYCIFQNMSRFYCLKHAETYTKQIHIKHTQHAMNKIHNIFFSKTFCFITLFLNVMAYSDLFTDVAYLCFYFSLNNTILTHCDLLSHATYFAEEYITDPLC